MIDAERLIKHLKDTGRIKLLPQILKEVRKNTLRQKRTVGGTETAKENPSLVSGFRTVQKGILHDATAKNALIQIYRNIIS